MNRFALLLVLPLLAGCDVRAKNPDGDENVSISADESGHIEFNLPIAEGKLKVPASAMESSDFDIDGVKLMPGSRITGFNLDAHNDQATVIMSFAASSTADEVRSYFIDEFRKQGTEAKLAGDAVQGKTKDGAPFVIHVSPAAKGSQGKIEIQDKG